MRRVSSGTLPDNFRIIDRYGIARLAIVEMFGVYSAVKWIVPKPYSILNMHEVFTTDIRYCRRRSMKDIHWPRYMIHIA